MQWGVLKCCDEYVRSISYLHLTGLSLLCRARVTVLRRSAASFRSACNGPYSMQRAS
jgi:hypothetical protein